MCFVVFAYEQHPRFRLVMATNRDEFYDRPTAPASFWEDDPAVLAGRDLRAGGTWLGVTRTGRLAALTNYREPGKGPPEAPSRGALVADFLRADTPPRVYLENLSEVADRYHGFNLLVGDTRSLCYFGNRGGAVRELAPGLYGLSNHLLDTPWPKVVRGKQALGGLLAGGDASPDALLELLHDTRRAPDADLPDTGIGPAWERILSPIFIESTAYGTRASTLVYLGTDGCCTFVEGTHTPDTDEPNPPVRRFSFTVEAGEGAGS